MKSIAIAIALSALVHAGFLVSSGLSQPVDNGPGNNLRVSLLNIDTSTRPARIAGHAGMPKPAASHQTLRAVPSIPVSNSEPSAGESPATKARIIANAAASDRLTREASAANTRQGRLQQRLSRMMNDYFYYPRAAQQRGIEGEVLMQVHIDASGHISEFGVTRGSGYAVLDEAALESLQQVAHSTRFTGRQNARPQRLEFPVQYRLVDP